jgi:cytochrome b561
MLMNTRDAYGVVARLLHWLIALLVFGMLLFGVVLANLPSGGFRSFVMAGHKSTGVLVLLLMIGRLLWRVYNPRPRDLSDIPVLNFTAYVLHVWLYVLLFLQPLSGILMSQAYGYPVVVFGIFTLPPLIWHSPSLGGVFSQIHEMTAMVLVLTVAVHAAAALKHHFIDRDRTLMRMLKGR